MKARREGTALESAAGIVAVGVLIVLMGIAEWLINF